MTSLHFFISIHPIKQHNKLITLPRSTLTQPPKMTLSIKPQKIEVFIDFKDPQLFGQFESNINKDFINIVDDITESEIFIRTSDSDLSDCNLPYFIPFEQFGKTRHIVVLFTQTKKLAIRVCFDSFAEKIIHNLNLLAYILLLKKSVLKLSPINQSETKISLKLNEEELIADSTDNIIIKPLQKIDMCVKNVSCVNQHYYLLLIGEGGSIRVVKEGLDKLEFCGNFTVDKTSPYYLTHQIDTLALISSPTKINLSDSLNTKEGYVMNLSMEMFTNIMKPFPNFNELSLAAHVMNFDIQSCPDFTNWCEMMEAVDTYEPPFFSFIDYDVQDIVAYQTDGPEALKGSVFENLVNDLQKLFQTYSIYQKLSRKEVVFQKK